VEWIQVAILGLGTGAIYGLAGQGLVLVYRSSGVLNFANGAIGTIAAFIFYQIWIQDTLPLGVAVVGAILVGAALSWLTYTLVVSRIPRSSGLTQVISTLGVLILLQGVAVLRYGSDPRILPIFLPTGTIHLGSQLSVPQDLLWMLLIGALITVTLSLIYRRTTFGLLTTAVAEDPAVVEARGQ